MIRIETSHLVINEKVADDGVKFLWHFSKVSINDLFSQNKNIKNKDENKNKNKININNSGGNIIASAPADRYTHTAIAGASG